MSSSTNNNSSTESVPISMLTTFLPEDFTPSCNEVMIGRGRKILAHSGNVKLRNLVKLKAQDYSDTNDKTHKSFIISEIGNVIRRESQHGGFVKKDATTGKWYVVSDSCIRATIAQAFRDHLSPNYRSSKFAKQRRRWCAKTASGTTSAAAVAAATAAAAANSSAVLNKKKNTTCPAPAFTTTTETVSSMTNSMKPLIMNEKKDWSSSSCASSSSSWQPMSMFNLQKAVSTLSFPQAPSCALTNMVASNMNSVASSTPQTPQTSTPSQSLMNLPMIPSSSMELGPSTSNTNTSSATTFAGISNILQQSLDILENNDDDDDDWISYSNNPFEPNPIAESTPEAATLSLGAVNEDWWF